MLTQTELKRNAAAAAIEFVLPQLTPSTVLGVGTGSTVDLFIDALAPHKHRFRGAVSSSERSSARMAALGIPVFDLNEIPSMPWYVDGADEVDHELNMIKGGGGALTREKIVASVAERFLCIVDESKLVRVLGKFPLPVEVIPMAREVVARRLAALGGKPALREGYVTDNGCQILDVSGLAIDAPARFEAELNNIPGVVCCGLFAIAGADVVLMSTQQGVRQLTKNPS
ncbi:ribose-5-phosphate isomerase RpiA [Parapusillimonas granuli]|uniref:Ribose-5-phosphate isomerase A n=1 Tax=Parapusillimonas granuli TaxID=380911 RepID=A0A853G698_9BURK|nr:ribose-5-phosphate isomerase RpiA [Parapusillimonas granuli]MBB5216888.1 ribose 5-phosphate isomerase A [Parapusillimonas granuli]MEB2401533.1 ribose-5-phosphate isomerase RpiA [Alcaligenaceae bacterium]NYT51687.1 ribose-5-phosphate isomerase RpiA [Parapusillimonas granuli]